MTTTIEATDAATVFMQLCAHAAIHHGDTVYSVKYDADSDGFHARMLHASGTTATISESTREHAALCCLKHIYGAEYRCVTKHSDAYVCCPAPGCDAELTMEDTAEHGMDCTADECSHFIDVSDCGVRFLFPKEG